jgi:7,8-dihydropterin-6-yl-methyl-4-(beta-D-ribofuranosyl)aminobenzene 5'-phosphate synthase
MKPKNASVAQQQPTTKVLSRIGSALMSSPAESERFVVAEADSLEVISLVDNSVDFLSTLGRSEVQSVRQWTRERYGEDWTAAHVQLPVAEHGFSALIRVHYGEKTATVLFDTGISSDGVVENARRMGLDLTEVQYVVLSHGHYDHCNGLVSALKAINRAHVPLIVHEDMFKKRGTANKTGAMRAYPEFPKKTELASAKLIYTKKPYLIAADHGLVTGEIPRETPFERGSLQHKVLRDGSWQSDPLILDDRALIFNVKGKGLVVLSGCAHAGIINTVAYARRISGVTSVCAIMGGFHLAGSTNELMIASTVQELEKINPHLIAPSHCTGWRGMFAIAQALPKAFVWNSVGNLYQF